MATATPACPERYPSPEASGPRVRVLLISAAGRGRRTTRLTSLARAQLAVPPAKPARKLAIVSHQRCGGCRGHGAERTELHDDPHGAVERVGQAVDGPEGPGLAVPYLVPVRR